ncbi:SnoaL-like polyketide cyclase [Nonomuraea coxensis DSM 45129]|uniref:SnoaL-like polyketide cyclase n=1 Tax=Nonomuraea coxensis DSM 45129 TaxID=1122611 RepID=A0ABX8U7H5_9ACTN|nr:ester cyclase [Nonomuraea coxensis]QYC42704.1 SnoaL-like polyketide cyclase [Nonomuraea coxensis DSM 45129]
MTGDAPAGAKMTGDARKLAQDHLRAWCDGDPEAVAATAASYADPDSGGVLSGPALAAHAAATLARFRGPGFETGHLVGDADAAVLGWTLRADHREPYLGMPATGGRAEVSGTDLVTVDGRGAHVRRSYDRLALAESLGYTARFVPAADEVREFGVSARAGSARTERPGALVLTWLEVRDDAEAAEVDLLSVEIVKSLRAARGFLGLTTFDLGDRKYTLSAYDRLESVRAVHARPHQRAMRRFFKSGLCERVHTSVWRPVSARDYARCPGCAATVRTDAACGCGWTPAAVPTL